MNKGGNKGKISNKQKEIYNGSRQNKNKVIFLMIVPLRPDPPPPLKLN